MIYQNMTPDDLKTGMIVTLRNGYECVVLRDTSVTAHGYADVMVDIKNHAWFSLDSYRGNFECRPSIDSRLKFFDIVKVEKPRHQFDCIDLTKDVDKRVLLWKEEEEEEKRAVKLTVSEIENRLGYKVEIVSEEE